MAILTLEDVTDVKHQPFSYGPGSFSCIVLTGAQYASADKISECIRAVEKVVGHGIRFEIIQPIYVEVGIEIILALNPNLNTADSQSIRIDVRNAISEYLQTLALGEDIIINEITQRIMDQSKDITDYICSRFVVNNQSAFYVNQSARWCEKFIPALSGNSILVK
jgi:uncharacterized phage protein gp47/JayE